MIEGLICGPGDAGYLSFPTVPMTYRTKIINEYRSWGPAGRCPEMAGYRYWLETLKDYAMADGGTALAYAVTYTKVILPSMQSEANVHDEQGAGGIATANAACAKAATKAFGYYVKATYITGSGNKCLVTF